MQTKILISEMPKQSSDCPFALFNQNNDMPAICRLKIPVNELESSIIFSHRRYTNCNCETCTYLKEI